MSKSDSYTSSLGLRADQAKWEFALPDRARRLIASGDFDGRNNDTVILWLTSEKPVRERLLRWCNSAAICNSPASKLAQSCQTLGEVARAMARSELARLAVLAFARGLFLPGQLVDRVQRDRLWGHSIAVGTVASMISRTCGRGDSSLILVAGTLHDIGLCANQRIAPESYREVGSEVDELSPTHEVEQDLLGWDHAQLGAVILQQWGMPEPIQAAARSHHRADQAIQDDHAETIGCVTVANYLCSRAGWSSTGFHNLLPPSKQVLQRLGIDSEMLSVIWRQMGRSLELAAQLH